MNTHYKLLLHCIILIKISYIETSEQAPNVCFALNAVFWKITLPYLKNKKGVIVSQKYNDTNVSDYFECLLEQDVIPIVHNKYYRNITRTIEAMYVGEANNYAFIFASDTIDVILEGLEAIYVKYTNVKTILICNDYMDIPDLLKSVWEKYNMLNVIAFTLNTTSSSSDATNIILYDTEKSYTDYFDFTFYDPFIMIDEQSRGRSYNFQTNISDAIVISQYMIDAMQSRLLDMQQYPLRIGLFDFKGLARSIRDENGTVIKYILPDGLLTSAVLKATNFRPVYVEPPGGSMYGGQTPGGTFNGVIGLLENKEVDVTFNVRVLKGYGQKVSTFLPSISETTLTFVAPNIDRESKPSFFEIFDMYSGMAISIAYIFLLIVEYGCQRFEAKYINSNARSEIDLVGNCIALIGILSSVSQKIPTKTYKRCLFAGIIYFSLIIGTFYGAKMVEVLTTKQDSQNLKTLKDVANSGLKVLIPMGLRNYLPSVNSSASTGTDSVYATLYERHSLITNYVDSYRQVAYERDAALFSLRLFSETYQYLLYSNETGKSLIHIVPEAPARTLLAYMVLKDSPFRSRLHDVVLRMRECGLYPKLLEANWYNMSLKLLKLPQMETKELFTMDELGLVFTLLFGCMGFSFVIFLMEVGAAKIWKMMRK